MLAVAGGKGGVGKTTTALGLARAAATDGHAPLVVEADRDLPDLAHVAGVPEGGLRAFADGAPVDACTHDWHGVRLVTARAGRSRAVYRRALRRAGCLDCPVLVDCPAGAGRNAALPIRAADRAVLVTTPTLRAQRDAVKTAAMTRALGTRVAGVCVRGDSRVPLLKCPTVARLPTVGSPLESPKIIDWYHRGWLSLDRQNV